MAKPTAKARPLASWHGLLSSFLGPICKWPLLGAGMRERLKLYFLDRSKTYWEFDKGRNLSESIEPRGLQLV